MLPVAKASCINRIKVVGMVTGLCFFFLLFGIPPLLKALLVSDRYCMINLAVCKGTEGSIIEAWNFGIEIEELLDSIFMFV